MLDRRCRRVRSCDGFELQPACPGAGTRDAGMTEVHRSHLWQLIAINAIWGLNIVAVKLSADRFPPVFLSFLRFLIVGLVVWPWLRIRRGEMRWLLIAATCSGGLQFALMYSGVALSGKHVVGRDRGPARRAVRDAACPCCCSARHIHWRRWLGIGMSFAGVVVIGFSPGGAGLRGGPAAHRHRRFRRRDRPRRDQARARTRAAWSCRPGSPGAACRSCCRCRCCSRTARSRASGRRACTAGARSCIRPCSRASSRTPPTSRSSAAIRCRASRR